MNGKESVASVDEIERGDSAPHDGPIRPITIKAVIVLEAILAFFGFASGAQFIRDPSGGTHDMDASILEGTPVGDFLLVGLFFVTCYGILPILVMYGLWRLPRWRWTDAINKWTGQNWAWTGAAATGVILIVWIIVEVYYIGSPEGFPRFLQVTFAALGAVILILAFLPRTRAYAKLAISLDDHNETASGATTMKTEERMRMAGIIAGISALVFAVPHFWFWHGVSLAYPDDFQDVSKTEVLLVVGGLSILAAVCAIVFTHFSWVRHLPESLTTFPAGAVSVGLTMWGLAYFSLQVRLAFGDATSSEQYFASVANPNAIWGLYWYSLFVVWGLSLGTATFYFHRLKKYQDGAVPERMYSPSCFARLMQIVNVHHAIDATARKDGEKK